MVAINCQTLRLTLNDQGQVISLIQLTDNVELLAAASHPVGLWELGLIRPVAYQNPLPPLDVPAIEYDGHEWLVNRNEYDAELQLDSDACGSPEVATSGDVTTLAWTLPVPDGEAFICLHIISGDVPHLSFSASVVVPESWAIRHVAWPRIRGFGSVQAPVEDALLYPRNFGILRRNPLEAMDDHVGQYPGGGQWGQFLAWLHGSAGLYLAVRDGDRQHTGLEAQYVEGAEFASKQTFRWFHGTEKPSWMKRPHQPLGQRLAAGLSPAFQLTTRHWPTQTHFWSSSYEVVLEGFHGTWYEASRLHRDWALRQPWCRRGPLRNRPTRHAAEELDLWFCRFGFPPWQLEPKDASEQLAAMLRLHDYFERPFGLHWYHWHAFNWHTSYPTHTPPVARFAEAVKRLQELGVVIMPYCQGRLLYRDRPDLDAERAHACVEANGQPYLEMYTKQDDWPLALCSHAGWSQEQWYEAARLLWCEYGVEGVYYDQISAMMPSLCYHAGHGHPLGGGSQTWAGYDQALARLDTLKANDDRRFVASECLTDAYMDRLDVFLAFVPPLEDYVPLWAAVYSGYTTTIGRATPGPIMADPQLFAICQGEQLLFGAQLGWMDEAILDYPEAAAFLKHAAELRSKLRDYLHFGTMLPALGLACQPASIQLTLPGNLCGQERDLKLIRPPVRQTVWEADDGSRAILLLNEARESVTTTLQVPESWQPNSYGHLGEQGSQPLSNELTLSIDPLSVVCLIVCQVSTGA